MVVPRLLPPLASSPTGCASSKHKNVALVALESVKCQTNDYLPCLSGGNDMPMVEAAQAAGYKLLFPRSEAGVGFIANGLAWESRLPTLCIVITSVGVYGLMQALYAAFVNERPLVVISGEVGSIGRGCVQAGEGWDGPSITQVTRPLTAWSVDAPTASHACRAVLRAVAIANASQRPVHVNIPLSVQKETVT